MNFNFFRRKQSNDEVHNNNNNINNNNNDNVNRNSNSNSIILEAFKQFGNQTGITVHWSDDEDDGNEEEDDDDDDDNNNNDNIHNKNNEHKTFKTNVLKAAKGSPYTANKFIVPENDIGLTAKHQVMADQMKKRVKDFTKETNIKIFCGTWNVSNKTLDDDDDDNDDNTNKSNDNSNSDNSNNNHINEEANIRSWLLPKDQPLCDIYAVGFQEICELSTVNVVLNGSKSAERAFYWKHKIYEVLCSKNNDDNDTSTNNYTMISENHLVGIAQFIFVKNDLLPKVSDVRTVSCGIGLLGFGGNKGGVTTRLVLEETSITFVTSHLRSGAEKLHGRNADVKSILEKTLLLQTNTVMDEMLMRPSRQYINADLIKDLDIKESDYIFWFGDLNYRLDESNLNTDDIWHNVIKGDYKEYLAVDQLIMERDQGHVFQGYEEGPIAFKPSYKFIPGTDLYDDRAGGKLRTPAWCDRILWKNNNHFNKMNQDYYDIALLHNSDHKPVGSIFTCTVRVANIVEERKIFQEVLQMMDKWENDATPKLLLEGQIMDFGRVTYNNIYERDIKIKNVGNTLASWQLGPGPMSDSFSKPWLYFSMEEGVLVPGDEVILKIVIEVDETNISSFPTDVTEVNVEEIIIVRAVNGGDFFCMISAIIDLNYDQDVEVRDIESAKDLCFGEIYDKPGHFEFLNPNPTETSSSSTTSTTSTTSSPPQNILTPQSKLLLKSDIQEELSSPFVDYSDVYETADGPLTMNPVYKNC